MYIHPRDSPVFFFFRDLPLSSVDVELFEPQGVQMTLIKTPLGCERKKQNAGLYRTYRQKSTQSLGFLPVRFRRCVIDMIRVAACKKKYLGPAKREHKALAGFIRMPNQLDD